MVFALFLALQLLDALTTIIFLHLGVPEANWIVNWVITFVGKYGHGPAFGMFLYKIVLNLVMGFLYFKGKDDPRKIKIFVGGNVLFVLIVIWNCLAILGALNKI